MRFDLEKITSHYGIIPQLKYFQSEVFELTEAIIQCENSGLYEYEDLKPLHDHIAEEIADCYVMLEQFRLYYGSSTTLIKSIMEYKVKRQLDRIESEDK